MRKFHSIAALCGDGLRSELQALFDRLAIDPCTELFVRPDGMTQSGPDPITESSRTEPFPFKASRRADLRDADSSAINPEPAADHDCCAHADRLRHDEAHHAGRRDARKRIRERTRDRDGRVGERG